MLLTKLGAYKKFLERTLIGFTYDEPLTDIISGYKTLMADRPFNIVSDQWIYTQIKDTSNWNVFEGSQGVLLDEDFGFHPHTTWSATTDRNARKLIRYAGVDENNYKTVGVTRTYATRHGYGPFPSEFKDDTPHYVYPEKHNAWGKFQGDWRIGNLDFPLLEYAVKVNHGVDEIALTHCDLSFDRPINLWDTDIEPVAEKDLDYQERLTNALMNIDIGALTEIVDLEGLVSALELRLQAPVTIESHGPTANDKKRV
jgi:adenylosuccinate synthase